MDIYILKSTGYKGRMEPNLHFRGVGVYLGGCVCYARGLLSRAMSREIRVLWQMRSEEHTSELQSQR